MFSQFKENMEINQGIHGPKQIKRETLTKDWTQDPHEKTLLKKLTKRAQMSKYVIP